MEMDVKPDASSAINHVLLRSKDRGTCTVGGELAERR
jgi:hypothetical protein